MLVSGPTSSGKTTYARNLLVQRRLKYDRPPNRVFWFYKVYQETYERMLQLGLVDEFVQGMPTMQWIEENIGNMKNCTLVIDDMALEANEDTAKIFTIGSHHFDLNVIFICQNLFTKNKAFREISLNSTYHVIFKNPRDKSSITHFAKQFSPGKSREMAQIFYKATKNPHTYLFLDYHQKTLEENRVMSNVLFEKGEPIAIYRLNT